MGLGIGTRVAGKYRIERLLGEGGMGTVYVAVNERLHKEVDRHRRTAKTYAEKSAAQTLMAAEALTEDAFADPEAYVKTRALIDRQINGPPGSDMVPVRALREWTAAFFATVRERHGDEEASALLKAIRRRMTSTQAENLPRLGTK